MEFFSKKFEELSKQELYGILRARAEIFVVEQKIIYNDIDGKDTDSLHCFIKVDEMVTAYLRAFYEDENTVKIGRVLTASHGNGYGRELMIKSIEAIKEKMPCKKLVMDAQKQAIGFYEKFGFSVVSDEFLEEQVVHKRMEAELDKL